VQLHNLHGGYFNLAALPMLSQRTPTIWTLHDAWALTGHCAYPGGCARWRDRCNPCPNLGLPPALASDTTAITTAAKRHVAARARIRLVVPSRWLARMVEASYWADAVCTVVPNGVDVGVFKPTDSGAARRALRLPKDGRIVLAYVPPIDHPYKGYRLLLSAIAECRDRPDIVFALVGRQDHVAPLAAANPNVVQLGQASAQKLMSLYLDAADIYLTAAPDENHPLAVLEALACGTPVVCFDVGGQAEIVEDGVTGWLVGEVSGHALARGLIGAADVLRHRTDMSSAARCAAESRFSSVLQARRYLSIYAEEVERARP
jgi:glycosyltransferase involved in cell wall biosynthesis